MRQEDRGLIDQYVDVTSHQILKRRTAPAVMNELKGGTDKILQCNPHNVRRATEAGGGDCCASGIHLQPGNQFPQIARWNGLLGPMTRGMAGSSATGSKSFSTSYGSGRSHRSGRGCQESRNRAYGHPARARNSSNANRSRGAGHVFDHHGLTRDWRSRSPRTRASVSSGPPAGYGTTE